MLFWQSRWTIWSRHQIHSSASKIGMVHRPKSMVVTPAVDWLGELVAPALSRRTQDAGRRHADAAVNLKLPVRPVQPPRFFNPLPVAFLCAPPLPVYHQFNTTAPGTAARSAGEKTEKRNQPQERRAKQLERRASPVAQFFFAAHMAPPPLRARFLAPPAASATRTPLRAHFFILFSSHGRCAPRPARGH
jgi:hypothetical protein